MDQLIEALKQLNERCREHKIDMILELIKIHVNACNRCNLKEGVKKLPW